MPRRWVIFWIFIGVLFSYLAVKLFFPVLNWRWLALALIIGGLSGWVFQKTILIPLKGFIKKLPVQAMLIQGIGVLFGLLLIILLMALAKPFLESMPLQNRFIIIMLLSSVIIGSLIFIISVKFKEMSYTFFSVAGQQSSKIAAAINQFKILDTSAIIDGRIADLCSDSVFWRGF